MSLTKEVTQAMNDVNSVTQETSGKIQTVSETMDEIYTGAESVASAVNSFKGNEGWVKSCYAHSIESDWIYLLSVPLCILIDCLCYLYYLLEQNTFRRQRHNLTQPAVLNITSNQNIG